MTNPRKAISGITKAVEIRGQITKLYKRYRKHQIAVEGAAKVAPHNFKRAVDAVYYLGGGWPHPSSKGRMEAVLGNVAEMYRVLTFVGKGEMVENYLADH